ncbi:quinone oxidoreductase family protein [Thermocrispum municipale]|uniref:quinone oxidoreductase family protein n=1 Tax=Thermocrispum municipale TaxID=37926 RepID=UPI0003F5DAAD|nr:quinone oxidoreductase [Thermocrispum municipale]
MPRGVQVREHGGPEVMAYTDVEVRQPGEGEILVDLAVAGVNFIDIYYRTGLYPADLPFTNGVEGAGVVSAVGPGVTGFAEGDRVAWTMTLGSYAEQVVVPTSAAVKVPDNVDLADAAAALLQGMTAHYLLHSVYAVQPGDAVLIHAAAGGTGGILTQWAKHLGATVYATTSPEKRQEALELGATEVFDYDNFVDQVREATGGEGVAAVYDGVGKTTFDGSLQSLRRRGTLALFGASSGPVDPVDPQRLNAAGSVFLTRPMLKHFIATREELDQRAADLFEVIAAGQVRVRIGGRYPLADAAKAHADLAARKTTGKLLLEP